MVYYKFTKCFTKTGFGGYETNSPRQVFSGYETEDILKSVGYIYFVNILKNTNS